MKSPTINLESRIPAATACGSKPCTYKVRRQDEMNAKHAWRKDRSRMRDDYGVAIFWIVMGIIMVAGAY